MDAYDTSLIKTALESGPINQDLDQDQERSLAVPNNGWTREATKTVVEWKKFLDKTNFVYQYLLDTNRTRVNRVLVMALLVGCLNTIISGVATTTLTVKSERYELVSLILNCVILVLNGLNAFFNGYLKIYKFDGIFTSYALYDERVDKLSAVINTELLLPDRLREDATTFISRVNKEYSDLLKQRPDVNASDCAVAVSKFDKMVNNSKQSERYRQYII